MAMLDLLPTWRGLPLARAFGRTGAVCVMVALVGPEALAAEEASPKAASGDSGTNSSDAVEKPLEEAPAMPPPADEPEWEKRPATRRSGFTAGILTAAALGMASGYPLDLKKIGRERYYTQSDVSIAGTGAAWLGFSLIDWLSVGLGINGNLLGASGLSGGGAAVFFRAEAFPMWSYGGIFREIGASIDAGAASALFTSTEDDSNRINAGVASYIGGSAFYEGIRVWHAAMGPTLFANYMWSDTVRYGNIGVGWRVAVYSDPVANKDKKSNRAEKKSARGSRAP
jgi:hypothetical protein